MNRKLVVFMGVFLMFILTATAASAKGHTASQLTNAGWSCDIAGPHGWLHCFEPSLNMPDDLLNGNRATLQVKVFTADGGTYLGAEILVHEDIYNWQPCMTDGGGSYEFLGFAPYYACHHFATD